MEDRRKLLNVAETKLTRRGFVQAFSAVTAMSAMAGCSSSDDDEVYSKNMTNPDTAPDLRQVRKVYSTCPVECLTHSLNCQVVGDHVVRVEPTKMKNDLYFTTACGRGMSRMQFLTENRAATPMKRIKKGTETSPLGVVLKNNSIDEWVSISWEQALTEIAAKFTEVIAANETEKIMVNTGSGNMGPILGGVVESFFAVAAPNRTAYMGNFCCAGTDDGMIPTFGTRTVDTRDTIRDSKCIVSWGNNIADTSNTYWKYVVDAKLAGAKLIAVDPRYSKTAEQADQWVRLYPGTDTLFAIGAIREILRQDKSGLGIENWIDGYFIKHRTNSAYLIDVTNVQDDAGNTVDLTNPLDKPWNKLYKLKYYTLNGKACVYDEVTGSIVNAEKNKGKNNTPTQEPDLYYSGATPDGKNVVTAFQLMRALYAGDILQSVVDGVDTRALPADYYNLHDPFYTDSNIVYTTGIDNYQTVKDFTVAYCESGQKSMIIQNMGGGSRTENGGHMCALQCILSLLTGNIGGEGNGVDDTGGYANQAGTQSDAQYPVIGTSGRYLSNANVPAGSPNYIPFGILGRCIMDANNGNAQPSFINPAKKDSQIKIWWISTLSLLTQFPNTDALKAALCSTEMVVAAKPTWNTDAEFADYILPVTTPFEYEDLGAGNRNKYVFVMEPGVKPYGQARSDMQILRDLAKKVFTDKTQIDAFDHDDSYYVEDLLTNPSNNFAANGITDYDTLKREKAVRPKYLGKKWVPLYLHEFNGGQSIDGRAKIFVTDWQYPSADPNFTPSELTANATTFPFIFKSPNPARDLFRGPFPRYIPAMESHLAPLPDFPILSGSEFSNYRTEYKLNCVQYKTPRSVHASFTGLPWIREAFGEKGIVLLNPADAITFGVSNGETVTVKSHTGAVQRVAKVTDFIMKGVCGIENSLWDKYGPVSSSTVGAEMPGPLSNGHTHNNTLVTILKGGMK